METFSTNETNLENPLIALVPTFDNRLIRTTDSTLISCLPLVSIGTTLEIVPNLPFVTSALDLKFKNVSK